MMVLIRFILINLLIYLIIRSIIRSFRSGDADEPSSQREEQKKKWTFREKGVSKEVGEYIDYEEIDKMKK
ncbi:MAG: hypothetical protein LLG13_11305 [Bacteroidales bacterium]|nr:hypothetical protein [Bacteroidales bacterium]